MEQTTNPPRTDLSNLQGTVQRVREEISKVIVGQTQMIDL